MCLTGMFYAMSNLSSARWIWWLLLYWMALILVPRALVHAWTHQYGKGLKPKIHEIFQRGELGMLSMVFSTAAIWNLQRSSFTFASVAIGSVLLGVSGVMGVNVWVEHYCRSATAYRLSPGRSWKDSRDIALLVFSIATVVEMLIDRLTKISS
jgi:hypothetical protein